MLGLWICGCGVRRLVPWALPKATLTMAVGQIVGGGGAMFLGRCP